MNGIFYPRRAVENLILNPQCLIAQEGTSFAALASGDYVVDGFKYVKSGAMVHTGTQAADNPAASNRLYNGSQAVKLDCTTADASIAAGDFCGLVSYVEGYDALRCYELPFVLTFWHKHTKTGTYCVAVTNAGTDRTIVKEYSQAVADTWEKTTLIFSASPSAGTWNTTNGVGFEIRFTLAAGSTYQTTADAWNTGNYYATSNQVNACDSTANNFILTDVALYPGTRDLGFYASDFQAQLRKCQRYFEKSLDQTTDPGASTAGNFIQDTAIDANYTNAIDHQYEVRKRNVPSITLYSYQNGTSGKISRFNLAFTFQADVSASAGDVGVSRFVPYGLGNYVASDLLRFHFTADARF